MSLTKDDLLAVQEVVNEVVGASEKRLAGQIEALSQDTALGFAEVHEKIVGVKQELTEKIDRIDAKLSAKDGKLEITVQRVDAHDDSIRRLNQQAGIM